MASSIHKINFLISWFYLTQVSSWISMFFVFWRLRVQISAQRMTVLTKTGAHRLYKNVGASSKFSIHYKIQSPAIWAPLCPCIVFEVFLSPSTQMPKYYSVLNDDCLSSYSSQFVQNGRWRRPHLSSDNGWTANKRPEFEYWWKYSAQVLRVLKTSEVHRTMKDKQEQGGRLVQKQNDVKNETLESSYRVSNSGTKRKGLSDPPIQIPHISYRSFNQQDSWNEKVLTANETNTQQQLL